MATRRWNRDTYARGSAAVLALLVVALLAGCGGTSTAGAAESLTKKAMKQHNTRYDKIACVEPSASGFVCEAVGSGSSPGFYAWCSIPIEHGAIGNFDSTVDCHWPALHQAPQNASPNNPVLTTPSRLGK